MKRNTSSIVVMMITVGCMIASCTATKPKSAAGHTPEIESFQEMSQQIIKEVLEESERASEREVKPTVSLASLKTGDSLLVSLNTLGHWGAVRDTLVNMPVTVTRLGKETVIEFSPMVFASYLPDLGRMNVHYLLNPDWNGTLCLSREPMEPQAASMATKRKAKNALLFRAYTWNGNVLADLPESKFLVLHVK